MLNVDASAIAATANDDWEAKRVEQLKLRSPAAWAGLFEAYHAKIHRFAWSKLRSVSEADDVTAVVFMRALDRINSYHYRGAPFVAWLYKIATNVIKERQRRFWRERRNTPLDDSDDMPQFAATGEDPDTLIGRLDLLDAIASLTKDQQTVITLIHVSGFSVREVAQILGKGERAVYYTQARGLMKLKQLLA